MFSLCLSVVFGKETWLWHLVVWLFANHCRCNHAVRGSYVWKVRTILSQTLIQRCLQVLFDVSQNHCGANINDLHCICLAENLSFWGFVVGRFGDLFGARAALSLACSATVVFFLLLAIADHPAMLFIHKLPTVFMHVLPGKQHSL